MCKRSDTERGELPSSTNLIASNFSSNVLLRISTVSVVSNFVGSLHFVGSLQYLSPDPLIRMTNHKDLNMFMKKDGAISPQIHIKTAWEANALNICYSLDVRN